MRARPHLGPYALIASLMTCRALTLDEAKAAFKKGLRNMAAVVGPGAWQHKITDVVSALIVRWDGGRAGISYTFADCRSRGARGWL